LSEDNKKEQKKKEQNKKDKKDKKEEQNKKEEPRIKKNKKNCKCKLDKLCKFCLNRIKSSREDIPKKIKIKLRRKKAKQCVDCKCFIEPNTKRCMNCTVLFRQEAATKRFTKSEATKLRELKELRYCPDCNTVLKYKESRRCMNCWQKFRKCFTENIYLETVQNSTNYVIVYFDLEKYIVTSAETGKFLKQCEYLALKHCVFRVNDNSLSLSTPYVKGIECSFTEILMNTGDIEPRKITFDPIQGFIEPENPRGRSIFASLQVVNKLPVITFFG
jgi:hypothetical protein